ncbi:MAG: DNA polymerase IV [Phycisphaerales bacterium]
MPARSILHVDMDAFFASVEQRDDPSLRGQPVLVGHDGPRGVVAAASYEARRFGCHSAMPIAVAKRRCPQAIIVSGSRGRYSEVSRQVFAIFERFTPLVQPLSVDEAFLDVTGSVRLFGSAADIAAAIRAAVQDETQLTCSVGVAPNKFLAKLGSDLEKPDALVELSMDDVPGRIAALPIERLWGVGDAAATRLHRVGLRTFGDLQALSEREIELVLGKHGPHLRRLALGIDARPVHTDREAKSISSERTFGENLVRPDDVRPFLRAQLEEVATRLRRHERYARTVTVKIRYGDFETITRSETLREPDDRTDVLIAAARRLFDAWAGRHFQPVRLIGAGVSNLADPADGRQVDLFAAPEDARARRLDSVTDAIKGRYGKTSIGRGGTPPRRSLGTTPDRPVFPDQRPEASGPSGSSGTSGSAGASNPSGPVASPTSRTARPPRPGDGAPRP